METLDALRAGQLKGIKRLNLAAGLTEFPMEVLELADSLEVLDLSHNRLTSLPDELGRLQNLNVVFFSNNCFEELPPVLSQCPNLSMVGFKSNQIKTIADNALPSSVRWLILTDNRITHLPSSFGQFNQLQKLMLAGNQLQTLPEEMAACHNLELVRLAANQLTTLPPWLLTLPRLSWLAYAGNPFCRDTRSSGQALPEIDWANLTVHQTLGEGASGVISQGRWTVGPAQTMDVAIKLFKGRITSDGLPLDEMRSCIAAGSHPHLVKLLGQVSNHPEQKTGLVFAFIPSTYTTLGHPPSLESCTRDTYPPGTEFALPVILRIAQGIAAAAAHLQAQGILHGDLYAHNILVDPAGNSLLGDFGAASVYPASLSSMTQALESVEVRAFGCLLEDLLERCVLDGTPTQRELGDRLHQLQHDCMQTVPALRPSFTQICEGLASLNAESSGS